MRHDFKTEFLVCLDLSQDVNYVVGRAPTMEGARDLARKARTIFPGDKVYITKEMVLRQSLSKSSPSISRPKVAANPEPKTNKCKCGKKAGQCVGSLGCQCNPIAMCKKADKWDTNPIEVDSDESDEDDELENFDVEEDFEFEDDEESEDGEYADNPEELEEEALEEEYETNEADEADEADEDDGEDEDYQDNPDEDDDEDDEDDEDEEDEDD